MPSLPFVLNNPDGTHLVQYPWSNLASGSTSWKQYVRVIPLTPLTLYDNADNTAAIAEAAADGNLRIVTLSGRTLYRDGSWNTLCLPFDVTISGSPLDGNGVDVRSLTSSSFDSSTGALTLTFYDPEEVIGTSAITDEPILRGPITVIEAGKPYIIKWNATSTHLTESDLVFTGVTIKSGTTDTATDCVTFIGTYDPTNIYASPADNLFLGTDNTLYWPSTAGYEIGPFRAYFHLLGGLTCGTPTSAVRAFSLSFNDEGSDETTGILAIDHSSFLDEPSGKAERTIDHSAGAWYTLDGRKVNVQSSMFNGQLKKGLYIHGGKKVVIH